MKDLVLVEKDFVLVFRFKARIYMLPGVILTKLMILIHDLLSVKKCCCNYCPKDEYMAN